MKKTTLLDYDSASHFGEQEAQAELLEDALSSGDARYIAHALGIIARARGMTQLANDTGIKRQALYRALSTSGNPTLETVVRVLNALGLRMKLETRANDALAEA